MHGRFVLPLILLAGCATSTPVDLSATVSEVQYGVFAVEEDGPRHLRTTDRIPCRPNIGLGSILAFDLSQYGRVSMTVGVERRMPEVPGFRASRRVDELGPIRAPANASSVEVAIVEQLDDERDLVNGVYSFRVFDPATDETLLARDFRVSGCP